jgi:hypothetical protein
MYQCLISSDRLDIPQSNPRRLLSRLDLLVNHDQAVPRVFPDGGKRVRLERRVLEDRLDVSSGRQAAEPTRSRQQ